MRVFLTGATGFIGSVIVEELLAAGHQVIGLARSDTSAKLLESRGVEVLRGSLDDLDSLKHGATNSDGVIHCAFIHGSTDHATSIKKDQLAIQTIGAALEGTNRPFIISSGILGLADNRLGTEQRYSEHRKVSSWSRRGDNGFILLERRTFIGDSPPTFSPRQGRSRCYS